MHEIELDSGETVALESEAIRRLRSDKFAGDANRTFRKYAPHVPPRLRFEVWCAADHFNEGDL
jgi:hypothetical protein